MAKAGQAAPKPRSVTSLQGTVIMDTIKLPVIFHCSSASICVRSFGVIRLSPSIGMKQVLCVNIVLRHLKRLKKAFRPHHHPRHQRCYQGFLEQSQGYELLLVEWAFPPVQRSPPERVFSLWTCLWCLPSPWSFPSGGPFGPSQLDGSGMDHNA